MSARDPRATPARPDLAAAHLRGHVEAARYAEPERHSCAAPAAPIRRAPDSAAGMDDQLLFGDGFDVYEIANGWAWGQSQTDSYVGYVRADQLSQGGVAPTHRVTALRAFAFSEPDLKSAPAALLSMNCRLAIVEREGRYLRAPGAGWLHEIWTAPLDALWPTDHAGAAERFYGAPYLWGGKESLGLDCSGLVQMALAACGVAAPRDTDQQEAALGAPVDFGGDGSGLQRGDLVFWRGHVGIMLDSERLIHANAYHMEVAIEPLAKARDRIGMDGTQISSVRRLG